tara:strand:+ start:2264 stop:3436 length:1173 start_codon:yes stop_codon:yes gene_type:complete
MQSNNHIQNLLNKFVLNQCSKEETEEVITYIQAIKDSSQIPSVEDVLELLDEKPIMSEDDATRIHNNVLEITRKQNKIIPKKKNYIWRYTAAAVLVGILATSYFFKNNILSNKVETTPIIVNTNTIIPGTDKATLTLENGSQIELEKGTDFQTQNANSNGEEIIYKDNQNTKKVVYNYLTIPRGGQFFIKLSDGTQVWLNSESQLKFPVDFIEGESRQVELVYGEAYFDVSPSSNHNGADFKVLNDNQEVQVLGTEFNIKAYKDEANIYTTLVEGKVAVDFNGEKQYLQPSQQSNLDINTKDLKVVMVDVYKEISWKDGVFSFRNKPLNDIMKVLSRWYDIKVVFNSQDLEFLTFNGSLDKKLSIAEILSIIASTNNISYEIKNKTILLK